MRPARPALTKKIDKKTRVSKARLIGWTRQVLNNPGQPGSQNPEFHFLTFFNI